MLRNEGSFDLVESARLPQEPLPSGRKLVVAGGIVLGSGAGLFIALLLELLDPLVRSRRDVMDLTEAELVWEFQRVPAGEHSVIDTRAPSEPVSILFRRLLNEMNARLDEDQWRCLAITSVEPHVGRSLVTTNLAQALVLKEQPVILVDADLRSAAGKRLSELFGLPGRRPGLWEALQETASVTGLLTETESRGLQIIGPGNPPPQQEGAADEALVGLGTRQMRKMVANLEKSGRHVLFDLPPLATEETSVEAAATIGNLLLVVRSGQTPRSELRETAQMLRDRGIHLRAVLLTDVPDDLLSGKPAFKPRPPATWMRWGFFRRAKTTEPTRDTHA
jgi:tyrosine-protein kinase Etk/Wzc